MGRARGARGNGGNGGGNGGGGNWMATAVKRPGAFKAKAQAADMGTQAYAAKVLQPSSGASPLTKKQANLAKTFDKYRP